jgi:membrane associated rhomboid family serine protease
MSRFGQMRITRGALYLLIAEVAVSLLFLASEGELRAELTRWLVATDQSVWGEGKVWTLVTSSIVQPDFIALIFHALILWMFVPVLERWWGLRKFLWFALYISVAANTVGTLVGLAMTGTQVVAGLDPFIYATFIAYGVLYADQQVQFFGVLPMTGRQLMIGISAFVLLLIAFTQDWARGGAYVTAMLLAAGLTTGKLNPRLSYLKWKQRRIRRKLKVMTGGRDAGDDDKKWMN